MSSSTRPSPRTRSPPPPKMRSISSCRATTSYQRARCARTTTRRRAPSPCATSCGRASSRTPSLRWAACGATVTLAPARRTSTSPSCSRRRVNTHGLGEGAGKRRGGAHQPGWLAAPALILSQLVAACAAASRAVRIRRVYSRACAARDAAAELEWGLEGGGEGCSARVRWDGESQRCAFAVCPGELAAEQSVRSEPTRM
mmetsp:Transcript_24201/g.64955  ORF Transcript_24201/g.64955 Transcript_24201/m.64955 type:complete len:200 (-) Transcript_24201:133-732(-)